AARRVRACRCDVTETAAVDAAAAAIEATIGPVSILVNNVGGSGTETATQLEEVTDALWDRIVGLNLGGLFRFSRRLVPGMKARKAGRIVNITSSLRTGIFGGAATVGARLPYITAKNGVVGFTRQLALDLGPFGITVNAVAPGFTLPDPEARITRRFRALAPEQQRELTANIPLGRPAEGEDIANAVLFLASPRSRHITGEVITVSGGA
ncbi:MAG: SDR family oxidoreductase, partial [Rhodospirillaceae bacterium]|nr:SDR family oxidoreductase [Rhodospirillaceae bacterium]